MKIRDYHFSLISDPFVSYSHVILMLVMCKHVIMLQMPALMSPNKEGKWWIHLIMQNIGMIVGFAIMLLIAVYEEQLIHLA